jgi:hypothetical protein
LSVCLFVGVGFAIEAKQILSLLSMRFESSMSCSIAHGVDRFGKLAKCLDVMIEKMHIVTLQEPRWYCLLVVSQVGQPDQRSLIRGAGTPKAAGHFDVTPPWVDHLTSSMGTEACMGLIISQHLTDHECPRPLSGYAADELDTEVPRAAALLNLPV